MYRGQETHPIRVNARYEMNSANSFFFKKFQKPCLQTDGQTDGGQTSGWIQYTPIPPSVGRRYNKWYDCWDCGPKWACNRYISWFFKGFRHCGYLFKRVCGVQDIALKWFELSNRLQYVTLNNVKLDTETVYCGVQQGWSLCAHYCFSEHFDTRPL